MIPVLINGEPTEMVEEVSIPEKRLATGGVTDPRILRKIEEDKHKLGWKEKPKKGYVKCALCGKKIERKSSTQRYCKKCSKKVQTARTSLRVFRFRHKEVKPHRTERGELYLFMPYRGQTVAVMIPEPHAHTEKDALGVVKSTFEEIHHPKLYAQIIEIFEREKSENRSRK